MDVNPTNEKQKGGYHLLNVFYPLDKVACFFKIIFLSFSLSKVVIHIPFWQIRKLRLRKVQSPNIVGE